MPVAQSAVVYGVAFSCGAIATLFIGHIPVSVQLLAGGCFTFFVIAALFPFSRLLLALIAGLLWANYAVGKNLASQLDPAFAGTEIELVGRVASIPDNQHGDSKFLFQVERARDGVPEIISLRWYRDSPILRANEVWRLKIRILPPRGRLNFTGFDFEKWLFARSIGALGTVRGGELLSITGATTDRILGLRQAISLRVDELLKGHPSQGLVKALAVGDRTGISDRQWMFLAASGTTHLLAISGMHIGMISLFGFWIGQSLYRLAPRRLAWPGSQRVGIVVALCFASFYAVLSGFVVPAQRALILLLIVLSGQLSRCRAGTTSSLLLALTGVVMLDPLNPLRTGFWLSFAAVAMLLYAGYGRQATTGRWQQLLRAQWVIIIGMTPLTLYWFQQTSLVSIPANLVAIPLVSLLVLPLVLVAILLLSVAPVVAGFLLWVSAQILGGLQFILASLAEIPGIVRQVPAPGFTTTLIALCGVLLILAPRAVPGRLCGLLLLLPLIFTKISSPAYGTMELTQLDVGQGSAALLRTQQHLLLFDTGPGDGGSRQLVDSTVRPAIQNSGFAAPDKIIVSHADLDHAGGMQRLQEYYPDSPRYVNRPEPARFPRDHECRTPLKWNWDGFQFTILHPGPGLPYLGNDSSCVLEVKGFGSNLLLPGDISEAVERRLLGRSQLPSGGVLVVPHHGSASSSSQEFVSTVKPLLAVISNGYLNRFRLPRNDIVKRYRRAGTRLLSTAECGAIRITINANGRLDSETARQKRAAIWRQKAAPSC